MNPRTLALVSLAPIGAALLWQPDAPSPDEAAVARAVDALYASISGPAGERDFTEFKDLFDEKGRLTAVTRREGETTLVRMTPDDWIERSGPWIEENGFFETGIAGEIEVFGSIAHVWSTYEARRSENAAPFARGINSIQLIRQPDSGLWKISTILWDTEHPDQPIPPRYLPGD